MINLTAPEVLRDRFAVVDPPMIETQDEFLAVYRESWRRHRNWQSKLCEQLNSAVYVRVVDDDTDLAMACAGRGWVPVEHEPDLPVGEVAVAPIEDQVTGHITFPGVTWFAGVKITDLVLDFCGGEVVAVSAREGEEFVRELVQLPGMARLGGFAIGTNAEIPSLVGRELLGQKFLGTVQFTLGRPRRGCAGENQASISWHIGKDLRRSGVLEVNGQPMLSYGQLHPLLRPVLRAI